MVLKTYRVFTGRGSEMFSIYEEFDFEYNSDSLMNYCSFTGYDIVVHNLCIYIINLPHMFSLKQQIFYRSNVNFYFMILLKPDKTSTNKDLVSNTSLYYLKSVASCLHAALLKT